MLQDRSRMPNYVGIDPERGKATLAGVSPVVVPSTTVQADSLIFLSNQLVVGLLGVCGVTAINPGVSFTITSVALNTSTIAWQVWPAA